MSTIASMRRKVSSGLLLWQVVREPSWPVLRAMTMSSASAPRTSPTTSRSGRRRSAARTNDRTVTSPTPSTDGGRASSRTTCGVARRSSAASSMVTTRSPGGTCPSSALRNVVFPEEVAPLTTRLARCADQRDEQRDDRRRGEGREGHAAGGEAADGEAGSVDGDGRDRPRGRGSRRPAGHRRSGCCGRPGGRAAPRSARSATPRHPRRGRRRARAGPAAPPRPRDRR